MEYAPTFFKENRQDVFRQHYNAPFYDPQKHFQDITGFSIAFSPKDQQTLASYLTQVGLNKINHTTFENHCGAKIKITDESPIQKGIYQITVSIKNGFSLPNRVQLGNSVMEIEQDKAIWKLLG